MGLAFTTKADVKATVGYTATDQDAFIDQLILDVSREAEDYMGRHALITARTEVYRLRRNQTWLSVKGFPISSVTSVKYAADEDFADVDALDTDLYSVRAELGQIRFRTAAIPSLIYDPGFVEVVYTGGLALDSAAMKANEPRLEGAVRTEVVNRFNRRQNPEGNLQVFGAGVGYQSALAPLKDFYVALDHRRRLRL